METVTSLGMGVAETWRGISDGRLRGIALESDVPLLAGSTPQDSGSNGTTGQIEN